MTSLHHNHDRIRLRRYPGLRIHSGNHDRYRTPRRDSHRHLHIDLI